MGRVREGMTSAGPLTSWLSRRTPFSKRELELYWNIGRLTLLRKHASSPLQDPLTRVRGPIPAFASVKLNVGDKVYFDDFEVQDRVAPTRVFAFYKPVSMVIALDSAEERTQDDEDRPLSWAWGTSTPSELQGSDKGEERLHLTQIHSKRLEDVINRLPRGVFPVGRLDKDTSGLLLLTNDGLLNHALLCPGRCTKEYIATFSFRVRQVQDDVEGMLQHLRDGLTLVDGPARALYATAIARGQSIFDSKQWWENTPLLPLDNNQSLDGSTENVNVVSPETVGKSQEDVQALRKARREAKKAFKAQVKATNEDDPLALDKESKRQRKADLGSLGGIGDSEAKQIGKRRASSDVWKVKLCVDQGRNRVVRRMVAAAGLQPIIALHRCRVGELTLSTLGLVGPGQVRELNEDEIALLMRS